MILNAFNARLSIYKSGNCNSERSSPSLDDLDLGFILDAMM